MSEWRIGQLSELATGVRGVAYTPDQLCEFSSHQTVTLLRSNNIQGGQLDFSDVQIVPRTVVSDAQLMQPGDIAVCMSNGSKALVGKAAPLVEDISDPITVGAFCSIFRPVPGSVRSYVKHAFQSASYRKQLDLALAGSAINNLRNSDIHAFQVPLPPPIEQAQIANILDTLDTTIRQTEAIIAKLKQVKQGLLHDLLTRGIDANGELRPPQSEAPHLYKASPLGWIPVEWDAVSLSELADNLDGRRLPIKGSERRQGMYPYYGASGIIDWVESYIFDGDYVLLGEDGENVVSRNLPLAFRVTGKIWVNNHAHIYEAKQGVDIRFLVEVLEAKDYGPWVSGSAQPKLTQHALAHICFHRPPTHEQQAIADRLESLTSRLDSERSALTKLYALKSGLMDDLLTGRVRVTPLLTQAPAIQP